MMRGPGLRWRRLGQVAVLALAFFAAPPAARAQDEEKPYREPGLLLMEQRKPYIEWIAGTLIVLACLLVAMKNPRRSHLD